MVSCSCPGRRNRYGSGCRKVGITAVLFTAGVYIGQKFRSLVIGSAPGLSLASAPRLPLLTSSSRFWKARHSRLASCVSGPRQELLACVTDLGQELENVLQRSRSATGAALGGLFGTESAGQQAGSTDPVPGLVTWLDRLNLTEYSGLAVLWCDQMGACDLDEVLENLEDLAASLALPQEEESRLKELGKAAAADLVAGNTQSEVRHLARIKQLMRESKQPGQQVDELLQKSQQQSRMFLRHFDAHFALACRRLGEQSPREKEDVEGLLAEHIQERVWGDMLYLDVMRRYAEDDLADIPCLQHLSGKTWAYSPPSQTSPSNQEQDLWVKDAGDWSFYVPLVSLTLPERNGIKRAALGKWPASVALLDYYADSELRAICRQPPREGSACLALLQSYKIALKRVLRAVAGASGLPDRNRTAEEAPLAFGLVMQNGHPSAEDARQVARLGRVMENTQVAQADIYFGHVLFGLCLRRIARRFELERTTGLLPQLSEEDRCRARLEVLTGKGPKRGIDAQLARIQFEKFTEEVVAVVGEACELTPVTLATIRRRTDFIFGRGLREEIFGAMAKASRASADAGERAVGPQICADFVLDGARRGEVRMLSASPEARERLMWDGILFGAFLHDAETALC